MNEQGPGSTFAVDFETYYTSSYSLKVMPTWAYVYHEEFDAYLVSVVGDDGTEWVGRPRDFDWSRLEGKTVLHHNAGFDGLVIRRLIRDGVIPQFTPAATHDTADLAAFLQRPRALKDFAKRVWGLENIAAAGAKARATMKDMPTELLQSDPVIREYARNDARLSLRIWREFSDLYPREERELSRLNREAGWRGIAVDTEYLNKCVERLAQRLFSAEKKIPWDWSDRKTPLARAKIIEWVGRTEVSRDMTPEEVSQMGETQVLPKRARRAELKDDRWIVWEPMWCPSSFAQDSVECMEWEDEFGDRYEWIGAIRDWRRMNMLYQKFLHLQKNTVDGIYHFQLKYYGARTGRFSGDGSFNLQNLPREEMFCEKGEDGKPIKGTGFDLRHCFKARPGKKLVISDYAQIEARVLLWIVGDETTLNLIRAGHSVYDAHARALMGWAGGPLKETAKVDKDADLLYRMAKARVLGGGYGGGASAFRRVARTMAGLTLTHEEAKNAVAEYRAANPKIVALWGKLQRIIQSHVVMRSAVYEMRLHSGRSLYYWNPRTILDAETGKAEIKAMFAYNSPSTYRRAWGGLLTENACQAIARDVLRDGWLSLERIRPPGYDWVLWTTHDEFITEADESAKIEDIEGAMLQTPAWSETLPLSLDSKSSDHYLKA